MAKFQIITEKNKPKYVVLPFGNKRAVEDYMEELWALEAIKKYETSPKKKLVPLKEVLKRSSGKPIKARK
jgi:uncharacterized protein YlbG (UPF0298 family)